MAYGEQSAYAKYLKNKISSSSSGCSGCSESSESTDWCACCPPGLVEVKDGAGNRIGCLTPADAQEYLANVPVQCGEGQIALYKKPDALPGESVFLGCVSESEFAALYAAVNPVV